MSSLLIYVSHGFEAAVGSSGIIHSKNNFSVALKTF
jgi:hypothetical protein